MFARFLTASGMDVQLRVPIGACAAWLGVSMFDVNMTEEHRIQVRVDDDEWEMAERAAKANGHRTVSALCRWLLQKEYRRLGITPENASARKAPARKKSRART